MSTSLSRIEGHQRVALTVPNDAVTAKVKNDKLKYDCHKEIQDGLTACFSNKTRQFVVLDPQGQVVAGYKKLKEGPPLKMRRVDTWRFSETVSHFIKGKIYIVLETAGERKYTFSDVYLFDKDTNIVELFYRCVVEPQFYEGWMLTGRSSKSNSLPYGTTYELHKLFSKDSAIQINIPPGNLPSAEMGPDGINFIEDGRIIARYDYEGRNIMSEFRA